MVVPPIRQRHGAATPGETVTEDAPLDGDYVQSLERGLSVIRAFDADHPQLTLSEVAAATGMSRAAARRFLHTLVHLGYMHNNNGRFSLRPRILELGYAYLSSLTLPEVAMPHLEELVEQVRRSPPRSASLTARTWSTSPACPPSAS